EWGQLRRRWKINGELIVWELEDREFGNMERWGIGKGWVGPFLIEILNWDPHPYQRYIGDHRFDPVSNLETIAYVFWVATTFKWWYAPLIQQFAGSSTGLTFMLLGFFLHIMVQPFTHLDR
ncbi:hypothetical protein HAX54_041248, partial [Datura stramonium]|nr:hypothetical protein [Datura stramonium]